MRNLILLVFDTARADAFEPWGAPPGATPVAAQLARTGTALPHVVAPSNWTLPSHASMFTGMLPGALGLTSGIKTGSKVGVNSRALLEERSDRVLAEFLRRRGYATGGISANPWIHAVNGFATGFDLFHSIQGVQRKPPGRALRTKLEWALDAWRARADDGATTAGNILRKWMDERRADAPFFWFVNLMECHGPYLPPRPFNDLSGPDRIRASLDAARFQTPEGSYRATIGELRMPRGMLRRTRHLYARAIFQMDTWLGAIVEELDRRGMLEETLVVLASDHGENLGENGQIGHVLSMSERLLRVPLVFSSPVEAPHHGPVSMAELPSMIAAALGIEDHPWIDDVRPHGACVSQVAGQIMLPEKEALARAWGIPDEAIRRMASSSTSATDGRFKVIRDQAGERLYDLASDPAESDPLDLVTQPAAGKLRAAIDEVESYAPAEPALENTATNDDEAAELEERLRQLGYI